MVSRECGVEKLLIIINFYDAPHVNGRSQLTNNLKDVLSSRMDMPSIVSTSAISIRPHESLLLKIA